MNTFNIVFTVEELNTIGEALGKLPYERVVNIFNAINNQVAAIQKEREEEAKKEAEKEEPILKEEENK